MNAEARLRPCQRMLLVFTIVIGIPLGSPAVAESAKLGRVRTTTLTSADGFTHTTTTVAGVGGEHGVGATKGCEARCGGEAMACTMTLHFIDDFDDVIVIEAVWDEVNSGQGVVRIPEDENENLVIIEVRGNALCTDNGGICDHGSGENCALPCKIGRGDSEVGGLPNLPGNGAVRFRQNKYVIQPDDPSVLIDTAYFLWRDECNSGAESCPLEPLIAPAASSTLVRHCPADDACMVLTSCNPDPALSELDACDYEKVVCSNDCGVCEVASCDELLGCVCKEDTSICDDNDACTDDSCDPIFGCLYEDIICDDQNACTADSCDSDIGCVYEGIDARCDDGNICTLEQCDPETGECVQLGALPCSDQDPCTVDSCDPDFGCVHDLTACCGITCPPTTKALLAIWNENERRFSGAQRCVESWDSTLLSEFADGAPNQLWRVFLQTNRGKARIDGVASPVVCGEDSIDAPLLGVASRVLSFGQNVARSGKTLVGQGVQAGVVEYSPAGGISVPAISQSTDIEESASRRAFLSAAMPVDPIISAETARSIVSAEARGGVGKKGSLLVYTSVEVKWDAEGNVVQDTFLELTNDYPREVLLQMYLVQGDTCMWADNVFTLTANQPIYWSARTGGPAGASPITVLGEACPDDDPTNPGGTRIRGYVMIWAVEKASGAEIRWNHLSGAATIINYRDMSAWEYNAWSFQTVAEVIHGEFLLPPYGQLDLDGAEYEYAPDQLLFDFFAAGAVLESGNDAVAFDTELTLWALNKDLR